MAEFNARCDCHWIKHPNPAQQAIGEYMLVDLSHYEFVSISGQDRHKFLQGQVSCDMTQLSAGQSLRGALCNLKGRVIADFRVVEHNDDILLQTQTGMATVIEEVLKKYAVFSKVEIQIPTVKPVCKGIVATACQDQLASVFTALPKAADQVRIHQGVLLIRSPGTLPCFELWDLGGDSEQINKLCAAPQAELSTWLSQVMRAGEIHVTPDLSEHYTPQLLNYDISGVINFKKGCYTGQEVVARMFYRAEAKKRLYLYSSNIPLDPDLSTINAGERVFPVLQVNNSQTPAEHLLFAVVDIDVAESGETLLVEQQPEVALTLLPLSYSL